MNTLSNTKYPYRKIFLAVFFLFFFLDIFFTGIDKEQLRWFTKPWIIPALAVYFISYAGTVSPLAKCLLGALFFSWMGDTLLMFQERDSLYFLLGLSAFLIAHLFYILLFARIGKLEVKRFRLWPVPIIGLYYGVLMFLLYPWLNELKIPVLVYGIVICIMLILATGMSFVKNKVAGRFILAGAMLFVLSDSILAINKFYRPFEAADVLIMLTYGLAQFFLATGASKYIRVQGVVSQRASAPAII